MNALDLGFTFSAGLVRLWEAVRRPWVVSAVHAPRIHVAGRAVLTPTHSVHLVEVEGRRMVLGCHPSGFLVLSAEQEQERPK
jgi:flagellar biogenesis protein FliO